MRYDILAGPTNLQPYSESGGGWSGAGATPPTVLNGVPYLGKTCAKASFTAAMTPGYAVCRMERRGAAFQVAAGALYTPSMALSLSRALVANEAVSISTIGVAAGTAYPIGQSADLVGAWQRRACSPDASLVTGDGYFTVVLAGVLSAPLDVYITDLQVDPGSVATVYTPTGATARIFTPTTIEADADFMAANYATGTYQLAAVQDAPAAAPARHITKLAFRNRFTQAEKVTLEIASLDDPAAAMAARQQAAALRASLADQRDATYIDLDRIDTRAGVQALETATILAAGRALQILDAPVTSDEQYKG